MLPQNVATAVTIDYGPTEGNRIEFTPDMVGRSCEIGDKRFRITSVDLLEKPLSQEEIYADGTDLEGSTVQLTFDEGSHGEPWNLWAVMKQGYRRESFFWRGKNPTTFHFDVTTGKDDVAGFVYGRRQTVTVGFAPVLLIPSSSDPKPAPVVDPTLEPGMRVVRFPIDRSMGELSIKEKKADSNWRYHGDALGNVVVPAEHLLRLKIEISCDFDFGPLLDLRPGDLSELELAFYEGVEDASVQLATDALYPVFSPETDVLITRYFTGPLGLLVPWDQPMGRASTRHPNASDIAPWDATFEIRGRVWFPYKDQIRIEVYEEGKQDLPRLIGNLRFPRRRDSVKYINVHTLDLSGTALSDGELESVQGIDTLRVLDLRNNELTSACLPVLKKMTGLQEIYLDGNAGIGESDLQELRKALPKCRIAANPSPTRAPLHGAATSNNREEVARLLKQDPSLIESRNEQGETPLIAAARLGHNAVVELLLEKGAEVNAVDNDNKNAWYRAAFNGHYGIANLLVEHGATWLDISF